MVADQWLEAGKYLVQSCASMNIIVDAHSGPLVRRVPADNGGAVAGDAKSLLC